MASKQIAERYRDQLEDCSSSVVTSESHAPKSSLFDTLDRRTIDECGLTEPTSVSPDEVLGHAQELGTKGSSVVEEGSAEEDALLLSDLDIDECPVEDSLSEVEESEHLENVDDALDLENTNFAPSEDVTTALDDFGSVEATFKQPPIPVAETSAPAPTLRCATESSLGSVAEIYLGINNTIGRWKWGSHIEFNVNFHSFPPRVDMLHAKRSLDRAAREWNKGILGVQFVPVANDKPAVFQLTYSSDGDSDEGSDSGDGNGSDKGALAVAFFPRDLHALEKLFVYPLAFQEKHKPNMTNVFCHELGHILGLRHEFAPQKEADVLAVQWGDTNPRSVMNYYPDYSSCRIQPSDYASVRDFYSFRGTKYGGFRIRDVAPRRFNPEPRVPTW